MKKVLILLTCLFLTAGSALAKADLTKLKLGVTQYKNGNYVGCMQTMEDIITADPGNALAHYYLAIAYVQVGKLEEAKKEYKTVILLNPTSEIAYYATTGFKNIESVQAQPAGQGSNAATSPQTLPVLTVPATKASGANSFMSDKAKDVLIEKKINSVINSVNQNGQVNDTQIKKIDSLNRSKSENPSPTKDEIAQAMQVLSSAGMSTGGFNGMNPEMMQMNLLMGSMGGNNNNMGNNSMNSMLPLLMMYQNSDSSKRPDPQTMEALMTGMMMPNMFSLNTNNNNNNDY